MTLSSLRLQLLGSALLPFVLLLGGAWRAALADVDVVIGYETRDMGELEECG